MKMGAYWATVAVLLVYLIVVWLLGSWLHLKSPDIWILRGGLSLIGTLGAAAFVWSHRKAKGGTTVGDSPPEGAGEVDLLVRDALRKLKTSAVGRSASLANLPLFFLLGEPGTTKTTTLINSGLDPELLAGHVYQDNQILATRTANIWYTRQAVFVDPSGTLLAQPGTWTRLICLLQPSRFASAIGGGKQAPRAAIVCFDCERFFATGATESIPASARQIATRLQEISQVLGISLPVYVLFTKVDRVGVSHFAEYVRNFNKEEAGQVFGTTLPIRSSQASGVYAEEETRRLTKAFDELFFSLADKRLEFMTREHDAEKRSLIYEFPREIRKLRTLVVQLLVDLGRPSHLQANPFLRGFYFSGLRGVVVEDVAAARPDTRAAQAADDAGATRIFSAAQFQAAPAPARVAGARKVPQWVFLSQFFTNVLLKDQVALSASGFSTRVSLLRRIALIALASLVLLCAIFFFISFIENHSLENALTSAMHDVPAMHLADRHTPSLMDLQHLDRLRQIVATLDTYEREGPPWHMRWGLYTGDELYREGRRVYFLRFSEMLFNQTQSNILAELRSLPDQPKPDSYEETYYALKAYLITTSNPEKSTVEFLSPVLAAHWATGIEAAQENRDLAKQQFDFYSAQLLEGNPYGSSNEQNTIGRARAYLANFGRINAYYVGLKDQASRKFPSTSFNRQFRDAADVVTSPHEVVGAFTRDGFKFMQDAIAHPSSISAEEWVIGKTDAARSDQATIQQLAGQYQGDFIKEWRTVLQTTSVHPYANFRDADAKLGKLTSPSSPLLEFFWFVSQNTNVSSQRVKDSFQPVQAVVPPEGPPNQYIGSTNQPYVNALAGLKAAMALLAASPTGASDANLVNQTLSAAGDADKAVEQVAQKFSVDPDPQFHAERVTQNLLEEPVRYAESVIRVTPVGPLNAAGAKFCAQFKPIITKFPFNPSSNDDVSIDQLNAMFAPNTGALWTFYNPTLAPYLVKQGSHYQANSAGSIKISPDFVRFFDRLAGLSEALYSGGSPTPRFSYSLTQLPSNVDGVILKIGSQTLDAVGLAKQFTWTGASEEAEVTAKGNRLDFAPPGPWSIFRLVGDARWTSAASGSYDLEWVMQSNGRDIIMPNGKKESFTYELQVSGFNPLHSSELASLSCVATVAH